jgi:hypothetical protein
MERDGPHDWTLRLPAVTRAARLRSRVFVPDALDRTAGDGRRLGVAVGALAHDGRRLRLDGAGFGAGWYAAEHSWRWTDADATLLLDPLPRPSVLRVRTVAAGARYWVEAEALRGAA